ncbi:MAG TPA: polysaccharide biosynthesis C-terminal domain-containing protein [Acetobacteraceae bacterium]|nr:polysaccharide biosynthesis C-terminal domain-containing protein [Acetobacteraceae bacterium]
MTLLRDSTLYFTGNVVARVVSFFMIPFYARHLSTAQYGVLNLVELATTITAIVFGLQSVGQTLTRVYHDQPDEAARRRVVATALFGTGVAAIAVALAAVAAARPIALAINLPDQVQLLRASFVAMVFATLVELLLVYQRMRGRARFFLAYSLVTLAANVALNVWFIGFLHFGVMGFVSSKLAVAGIGSVFLLVVVAREVGLSPVWRHGVALVRFGAPLALSGACYFTIHFSDRLFLAHVSQAEVGVYSMAYTFAMLLSVLVGDSFGKSWNVSFYKFAEGDGWQDRFMRIGGWLVFVLAAAAMGIAVFGRDTLRVMVPHSYLPPLLLLPLLVFGYFFRELGDFFRNMLLIDIGSGLVGRIAVLGAAINLVLNFLLIGGPFGLGIWGAAIATFLTWLLYCGVCWVAAVRLHRVDFRLWPLLRLLALGALALFVQAAWRPESRFLALASDCVVWSGFFLASLVLYLGAAERREFFGFARRGWQSSVAAIR